MPGLLPQKGSGAKERAGAAFARLPLTFEANRGQTDDAVKFLSRGDGYTLFLTPGEAVLSLRKGQAQEGAAGAVVRMRAVGASGKASVRGMEEQPGRVNYFLGNDPKRWRTNVPTYGKVRYDGVYPGVDLVYYGNQRQLEYDFVVAPGADPSPIRLAFEGAERLEVDAGGDLVLHTDGGAVRQKKPFIYQEVAGQRRPVAGSYVQMARNEIGFRLGRYDRARPLVIDPVLVYSSYLGGSSFDRAYDVGHDGSGNIYVTGHTGSWNFPAPGPTAPRSAAPAYVTKLSPDGSTLLYSSFLGGSSKGSSSRCVAVDEEGNAYLTGVTSATDFPLRNAFQPQYGGGGHDGFAARLDPTGSVLIYSTFLGGSAIDTGWGITTDVTGHAYVTGFSDSYWAGKSDFPVLNARQPVSGGSIDAFITKLDPAGAAVFSTYLGGSYEEYARGIAVDPVGNIYVTGWTGSVDFPTANALQPTKSSTSSEAFVTKLNPAGSELVYSTYLGGTDSDDLWGIRVDGAENVYLIGTTSSRDFPTTPGAFQRYLRDSSYSDAVVVKMNSEGSGLVFSTYLGGRGAERGRDLDIDSRGHIYVTGDTNSSDFPRVNPSQPGYAGYSYHGDMDAFVTTVDASGGSLRDSTHLGGLLEDNGHGISVASDGIVHVTGSTASENFPVRDALMASYGGGDADGFLATLAGSEFIPAAPSNLTATPVAARRIDLSWTDESSNETGFEIERAVADSGYSYPGYTYVPQYARIAVVGPGITAYSNTGLDPRVGYLYRVRAVNRIAPSGYSNVASAKPFAVEAPTNLRVDGVGSREIRLAWKDNSPDESGFAIIRKSGDGQFAYVTTTQANETTFSDTGLSPETTYTYRVRAVNMNGESDYSNEASATPVLVAPGDLKASAASSSAVSLSWSDNSPDESGFQIERKSGDGAFTRVTTTGANVTNFSDGGLSPETTYTYRVRAATTDTASAYSNDASATTVAGPSGLTAKLVVVLSRPPEVRLSWKDNSSIETGYEIERRDAMLVYTRIATVGANVRSYVESGIQTNTTYTYRVRAKNDSGVSDYSNEAQALPSDTPDSLAARAVTSTQVSLSWSDNSDTETGYVVERKSGSGAFSLLATALPNATTYTDGTVTPETAYTYRVRTATGMEYTNEAGATPIAAPARLTATSVSHSEIRLEWTDQSSREACFKVLRKSGGGAYVEIGTVGADVTSFKDTGLAANTTYRYHVRAANAVADSSHSNSASATTAPAPAAAARVLRTAGKRCRALRITLLHRGKLRAIRLT